MRRLTALVTAIALCWAQLLPTGVLAAESEGDSEPAKLPELKRVRTIQSQGSDGWSVVEIRDVEGKVIVLTPVLGREVDLTEANRFALFQGRNVFNNPYDIRLFNVAVAGFQNAVFMRTAKGKPAVKIEHRSGKRIQHRIVPIRTDEELRLLREYVEHFEEIQEKKYVLGKTSKLAEDDAYPMDTDETLTFQETRTRAAVRWRTEASVLMKDGERIQGELIPVYEDGEVLMESDLSVRRLPVGDIDRFHFKGDGGSGALSGAFQSAVGGVVTGAVAGALAAWQSGASVKRTTLFAASLFGVVGFIFGLASGSRSARGSREFVLGPVQPRDDEDGDSDDSDNDGKTEEAPSGNKK